MYQYICVLVIFSIVYSRLCIFHRSDNQQRQKVTVGSVCCLLPLCTVPPVFYNFNNLLHLIGLLRDKLLLKPKTSKGTPVEMKQSL